MNNFQPNKEFRREELIANVLSAHTQDRRKDAEQQIIEWMREHPRDFGILDAGEQLAMISERYEMTAEEIAGENE